MFKVCDAQLQELSSWPNLAAAKVVALNCSSEYPGQTFFVCDSDGSVVAGYTRCEE